MLTYLFIVGLILGSFFNVVGLRVPKQKSIIAPRSSCPTCHHTLTWKELIPVLSFLWQRGRCTNCKKKISSIYPVMELLTGVLFAFSYYVLGYGMEMFIALSLISLLHIITVSDLSYMIIPNKILLVFLVLFIFLRIITPLNPWYDAGMGFIAGLVLLLLIALVSRGGMGGGDIKLFAVLGIALGLKKLLLAFFLSAFLGATIGLIGLIVGLVKRKNPIPFGPFISMGALISYFYGTEIVNWYFSLFL
ncbi:prepilin peptidase [Bacillaceae bacterium S4-13-58]